MWSSYTGSTQDFLKSVEESHMKPCMYWDLEGTTVHNVVLVERKMWLMLKGTTGLFLVNTETGQVWFAPIHDLFLAKKG